MPDPVLIPWDTVGEWLSRPILCHIPWIAGVPRYRLAVVAEGIIVEPVDAPKEIPPLDAGRGAKTGCRMETSMSIDLAAIRERARRVASHGAAWATEQDCADITADVIALIAEVERLTRRAEAAEARIGRVEAVVEAARSYRADEHADAPRMWPGKRLQGLLTVLDDALDALDQEFDHG